MSIITEVDEPVDDSENSTQVDELWYASRLVPSENVEPEFEKLQVNGKISVHQAKILAVEAGIAKQGRDIEHLIEAYVDEPEYGLDYGELEFILIELKYSMLKIERLEKDLKDHKRDHSFVSGTAAMKMLHEFAPHCSNELIQDTVTEKSEFAWRKISVLEYTRLTVPTDERPIYGKEFDDLKQGERKYATRRSKKRKKKASRC
jgi:hypothetical protein